MDTQTRQLMEKINRIDKYQTDQIETLQKRVEILEKEIKSLKEAKKEAKKAIKES